MTLPVVLQRVKDLGYAVFDGEAEYDLNLVAVRSSDMTPDVFNDLFTCSYKVKGPNGRMQWITRSWKCTTDPGLYWLNRGNVKGTAVLCPGQYRGVYRIDKHAGKYYALCQRNGPVRCFRDSNRDSVIDMDPDSITEGSRYGINIHRATSRAGRETQDVGMYSAGCTVLPSPDDFSELMGLARKQVEVNGWESFTYTLLEAW